MQPPAETSSKETATERRRNRRTLLIVALIFLVPVAVAGWLAASGWRPQGRNLQHGELLQPARPVADVVLRDAAGRAFRLASLRGKWVLLNFGWLPCVEACRDNLYKMQQVWLAQGKDAGRVERAFVLLEPAARGTIEKLAGEWRGLQVLRGERDVLRGLAQEFATRRGTPLDGLEQLYLLDPHGNLVLIYAPDADPSGIRKDLARLLKLSQIG